MIDLPHLLMLKIVLFCLAKKKDFLPLRIISYWLLYYSIFHVDSSQSQM